ncbi:ArsR family transcriptional regulator [Halococcus sp. IIIV-5B]|uniref:ArsR family transcriptional regulator n=1 Tax=Halococcus sp. IIIV-5B TaxID=2321230 RepID=UPI000E71AB3E|nr:ArsR family transcriptional regulator [Halococcus sp. IIIV-5B]RJT07581.1 ArsR family transcriptional regulator [Halococcus sp. IIIV-5B]
MEERLRELLVKSRGGATRAQIVAAVETRPRSTHRLADDLDFDDKTIRHHLRILIENGVLQRSGNEYGAVYLLSDRVRYHRELLDELVSLSS